LKLIITKCKVFEKLKGLKLSEIKQFIKSIGGNKFIAEKCGISPTAVSLWIRRQNIPAKKALILSELSRLGNNEITPEELLKKFTKGPWQCK